MVADGNNDLNIKNWRLDNRKDVTLCCNTLKLVFDITMLILTERSFYTIIFSEF